MVLLLQIFGKKLISWKTQGKLDSSDHGVFTDSWAHNKVNLQNKALSAKSLNVQTSHLFTSII